MNVNDNATNALIQQIRRRLSILERPLITARGTGKVIFIPISIRNTLKWRSPYYERITTFVLHLNRTKQWKYRTAIGNYREKV